VDLFVSEALTKGEAMGRIVAVQTTLNPESRKRIQAFAEDRPVIFVLNDVRKRIESMPKIACDRGR